MKESGEQEAQHRVGDNHQPVAADRCDAELLEQTCAASRHQRAKRGCDRSDQRVPRQRLGAIAIRHDVRHRRLLDREERADFVTARADHTNGPGHEQETKMAGRGEGEAGRRHEHGTDDQHAPTSNAVGARRQRQRHDGVADQRQRQEQSGLCFIQADADEIEHEHDRQRPVREEPDKTGGEEQPPVSRQMSENDRQPLRSLDRVDVDHLNAAVLDDGARHRHLLAQLIEQKRATWSLDTAGWETPSDPSPAVSGFCAGR